MYDVLIIGAGVVGSAIARELSKFDLRVGVIEKEADVCCGTSKANSGIVHAGYDAPIGSLMAKLNVKGAQLIRELSVTLDFKYDEIGSLLICKEESQYAQLLELYNKGIKNGVKELKIIKDKNELVKLEPNLCKDVYAALYASNAGIVCPFGLNIALAENACDNGVEFIFNTEVLDINKTEETWVVDTSKGSFSSKNIVNAAGLFADRIHNMVSSNKVSITPRKGEYFILDKEAGSHVNHVIFALPNEFGKGVLVAPTVHGNLLLGPTAYDIEDKEGTDTTEKGLDEVRKKSSLNVKDIPFGKIITSFAGLRAHGEKGDFIIEESSNNKGFIDCIGIESPGLTSSPAIGEYVAQLLYEINDKKFKVKDDFIYTRKGITDVSKLSEEEYNRLIKENSQYGNIVCRCESICEGVIVESLHRSIPVTTVDGVKRRTTVGMGRCQSGFCTPKVIEIIARENNMKCNEITKNGTGSELII